MPHLQEKALQPFPGTAEVAKLVRSANNLVGVVDECHLLGMAGGC